MRNKIISLFAKQSQTKIVKDVANVKYFSVLADEACDSGQVEQFNCHNNVFLLSRFARRATILRKLVQTKNKRHLAEKST